MNKGGKLKGGDAKAEIIRNKKLVMFRRYDKKLFSYSILGILFKMNKKTAYEIYKRDKGKYKETLSI